jgi:hypothetical protein
MCSAQDTNFDPSNANGSGGIWPFWLTLIGEGLIEAGRQDMAADVLQMLVRAQVEVFKQQHHFTEFYHSDQPVGLGERSNLNGIIPLHLLMRMIGVRVISGGKVWAGGSFAWGKPVTITQHGVTINRSAEGTSILFPSGHQVNLSSSAAWQQVIDPKPVLLPPLKPVEPKRPAKKPKTKSSAPKKVD